MVMMMMMMMMMMMKTDADDDDKLRAGLRCIIIDLRSFPVAVTHRLIYLTNE